MAFVAKAFVLLALASVILLSWIWLMSPIARCGRALGIKLDNAVVTEVVEHNYGEVYFLRMTPRDAESLSMKIGPETYGDAPAMMIPDSGDRKPLGMVAKCFIISEGGNRICRVVVYSDTGCVVVMCLYYKGGSW